MISNERIRHITDDVVNQTLNILPNTVDKIILFGSYAKGTSTVESDLDIMILLNCEASEVKRYRKAISILSSRLGLKNDVEISLILRDSKSFYENLNILPFYRNINVEGISLYEQ